MSITYRSVFIKDLDAIQGLYVLGMAEVEDPFQTVRVHSVRFAREMRLLRQQLLAEQRYIAWVAEKDGEIVGYCAAIWERQASMFEIDSYVSIHELYVDPALRRQGIATQLMHHIEDHSRAMGIAWLRVSLPYQNESLQAFFKHFNYQPQMVEWRKERPL